jgi:MFS family permease
MVSALISLASTSDLHPLTSHIIASHRRRFGPGRAIPLYTIIFGILSIAMAFVTNLGSGCAVRFLLGAAEAGMLPGIAYYLSRWYPKRELAFRLAMYLGESAPAMRLMNCWGLMSLTGTASLFAACGSVRGIVGFRNPQDRLYRLCQVMGT